MWRDKDNMKNVNEILPELGVYLKAIEPICKFFPVCCQESSVILYIWLKKCGIDCEIVGGDIEDPAIGGDSVHFWIETENLIIDGTSVQFLLSSYENLPKKYSEIEDSIYQVSFLLNKGNGLYKNRVRAYIDNWLKNFIAYLIDGTSNTFDKFIVEIKEYFDLYGNKVAESNQLMMFSTLCVNNIFYYNRTLKEFINRCIRYKCNFCVDFIDMDWVIKELELLERTKIGGGLREEDYHK